jgi:ribosomal protein S1
MATNTSNNKPQSAMAQLLAAQKNKLVTLKKGESIKGKLTKMTSSEILVDVGAKTEALVLEREKHMVRMILSLFKVGDTVEVNVLNPESDSGQPIVSLRRYLGNLSWTKLEELQKSKAQIEVSVTDTTKAGYLVTTDFGISGFLPQSHTSQELTAGQKVKACVLELNRKDNKIIFSQKATISEEEFAATMKEFKTGQKVEVTVLNITSFGLFVSFSSTKKELPGIEGFIHISEIAWDKVADLSGMFTVGQKLEAVVIRFDAETKKINLSIKRLTQDPFEEILAQFSLEKKVKGTVAKVEEGGVTVTLSDDVEGFIRKDKIPPMTTYTVGQEVTVTVAEHDKKRHRIVLVPVLLEKPIGYR